MQAFCNTCSDFHMEKTAIVIPFFLALITLPFSSSSIFLETFLFFLTFHFEDVGFPFSLFSDNKYSAATCFPGSNHFPLFLFSCFLCPTPQLSLGISRTDWLKGNSFTFVVSFMPGNLFKTSFLSNGTIAVARKPDTRLSDFRWQNNLYSNDGNMVFERLSADQHSFLQVSRMSCHSIFIGQNTATFKG